MGSADLQRWTTNTRCFFATIVTIVMFCRRPFPCKWRGQQTAVEWSGRVLKSIRLFYHSGTCSVVARKLGLCVRPPVKMMGNYTAVHRKKNAKMPMRSLLYLFPSYLFQSLKDLSWLNMTGQHQHILWPRSASTLHTPPWSGRAFENITDDVQCVPFLPKKTVI